MYRDYDKNVEPFDFSEQRREETNSSRTNSIRSDTYKQCAGMIYAVIMLIVIICLIIYNLSTPFLFLPQSSTFALPSESDNLKTIEPDINQNQSNLEEIFSCENKQCYFQE